MISLEGSPHKLCSGVSRRDALKIGTLGIAGFSLAGLLQGRAEAAAAGVSSAGKAKTLIMIHLSGGPSHVDSWDPKPDAPAEVRGEFKTINSNVAGIQLGEHYPMQAQMMDKLAIIRSIHRVLPEEHASSHMCTGWGFTERRNSGDRPCIGSVISKMRGNPDALLPSFVALRGVNSETGLNAAYLGPNYEPLMYEGPGREDLRLRINMNRLTHRRQMLDKINSFRKDMESRQEANQDVFAQRALEIVSSSATYNALDISKEPEDVKKRYGNDHFLRARRLVEAGVQCIALEVGGWDTHSDNFNSLKKLMPSTDQAFSALVKDLIDRGLYDSTAVIMWGEFGRTPKVNGSAGRDHWPSVMSAILAGGGMKMGQVIGSTDPTGSEAKDNPIHVRAVLATLYASLGIDPKTSFTDNVGRPLDLIPDQDPIPQLIG
jgi:hypothetical protein